VSVRKPFFAANWKMFKTPDQARDYARAIAAVTAQFAALADIVVCPPFIDLEALGGGLRGTSVGLGAQDCFWLPEGAFTGEVSAAMLAALGCSHCIVGHSERRQFFGETDETVAKKVSALLALGITPIMCVGETLEEHKSGMALQRVMQQVNDGLGHLDDGERASLIVAYEPIWAIGTGMADSPDNANRTISLVRQSAGGLHDARILYGGSMKPDNVGGYMAQPDIDGGLIGSASLDPAGFVSLIGNGLNIA
jgi:triosephosphate isomerase (TIM)